MSPRGRLPRALALVVLLAAAAALTLALVQRRALEVELRLWQARHAEDPRPALARLAALLGYEDPRVEALFAVRPGELRVRFAPEGPHVTLPPGSAGLSLEARIENVSGRRLILIPERAEPFIAAMVRPKDGEWGFFEDRGASMASSESRAASALVLAPGAVAVETRRVPLGRVRAAGGAVEVRLALVVLERYRVEDCGEGELVLPEYDEVAAHPFTLEAP